MKDDHIHIWKFRTYESKSKKNLLVARYCPGCKVEQWTAIEEKEWSKGHKLGAIRIRKAQRV